MRADRQRQGRWRGGRVAWGRAGSAPHTHGASGGAITAAGPLPSLTTHLYHTAAPTFKQLLVAAVRYNRVQRPANSTHDKNLGVFLGGLWRWFWFWFVCLFGAVLAQRQGLQRAEMAHHQIPHTALHVTAAAAASSPHLAKVFNKVWVPLCGLHGKAARAPDTSAAADSSSSSQQRQPAEAKMVVAALKCGALHTAAACVRCGRHMCALQWVPHASPPSCLTPGHRHFFEVVPQA